MPLDYDTKTAARTRPTSNRDPGGRTALPNRKSSARLRLQQPVQGRVPGTEMFAIVAEAQGFADSWCWEYNTLRPHSVLQGHTPLEAAQPVAA